jgi:acyl carrier protein
MKSESLIRLVEVQLGRKKVKLEDRFAEDLGAESIDMVNLMVTIEENTGVFIPEEVIPELKTLQDLLNFIISSQ